jgi:hypothetical protein
MGDSYMPIDPERKLQQLAVRWATTMQRFGGEPSCKVAFASDGEPNPEPVTAGWLLHSSEVPGRRDRYLLLPDGGVWHEVVAEPPVAAEPSVTVREWVDKPTDELVTLLGRSVTRVQYGFADEHVAVQADPVVVHDRRRVWRAHPGSERRGQG